MNKIKINILKNGQKINIKFNIKNKPITFDILSSDENNIPNYKKLFDDIINILSEDNFQVAYIFDEDELNFQENSEEITNEERAFIKEIISQLNNNIIDIIKYWKSIDI